jgi:hypothetical protein
VVCAERDERALSTLVLGDGARVVVCGSHDLMYRRSGQVAQTVADPRAAPAPTAGASFRPAALGPPTPRRACYESATMRIHPAAALASLLLAPACGSPAQPPATPPPPPPPALVAPPVPAATADAAPVDAGSPEVPAAIDGDVRELQRAILASRGAADVVASLTTEVGPRLAGSPGDKLAVKWALHTMEARGLTNVHAEPAKVRAWQRGVETAAIVAPVKQPMAVTALGWSGATPAKGIEADVARFDSLDALKNADPKGVAGKIAFVDVKMERTATFKGYGDAVSARGDGPKVAATKGALAFLVRSIGTDQTRFPHAGASRQIDEKTPLPAGAISNADADLLDRVLAAHGSARLALNLGPKRLAPANSANVVGEIPGSSAPDEVVLLGAHLDSWDLGQGAIDDGAGCGIVLEAAHAIGALAKKSRRTVRVVLFASEEYSGDGSKEYARAHASDAAKIVVALEADEGTDRVLTAKYLGDPARRAQFLTLGPALAPLGVTIDDKEAHGGSDIGPLRAIGVPIVDLNQDATHYFDTHHTANDTFERIDPVAIQQASAAFATAAWTFANMNGDFGRVPESARKEKW